MTKHASWGQTTHVFIDTKIPWYEISDGLPQRESDVLSEAAKATLPELRNNALDAISVAGVHDLHYRTLRKMGVTLLGHFLGTKGHHARFAPM